MASSVIPEIGSRISLISKSGIRYEGSLYAVDPDDCTIALSSVRSFGTENRDVADKIPAVNHVYEYILFRGSDIKDIQMVEASSLPNDPAILQTSANPTTMQSQQQPQQPQQQQLPVFSSSLFNNNPNNLSNLLRMPVAQTSNSLTTAALFPNVTASLSPATTSAPATPSATKYPITDQKNKVKSPPKSNEKKTKGAVNAPKTTSISTGTQYEQRQPHRNQYQQQQHHQQQQRQEYPMFDARFDNFTRSNQQPRRQNQRSYATNPNNNAFQQSQSSFVNYRNNQQQQQQQPLPHQQQQQRTQNQQRNYDQHYDNGWPQWSDGSRYINGRYRNGYNNSNYQQYGNYRNYQNGPNAIAEMRRMGRQILSSGTATATTTMAHQRGPMNRVQSNDQVINSNRSRTQRIQFKEDYDFEKANNEFEELCQKLDSVTLKSTAVDNKEEQVPAAEHATMPNDETETSAKQPTVVAAAAAATAAVAPAAIYYDKTKSFFDNISCDESDANQKPDRNKEWKLNSETFGLNTNNRRPRETMGFMSRNANGGNYGNNYNRRNYFGGNANRYGMQQQQQQPRYHYDDSSQYQYYQPHQPYQYRNHNRSATATVGSS